MSGWVFRGSGRVGSGWGLVVLRDDEGMKMWGMGWGNLSGSFYKRG